MRVYSGSSVGSGSKEMTMKGLNFTIEQISDDGFLIDARITRRGKQYRKREKVQGKRNAERRASQIVWELEDKAEAETTPVVFETFGECAEYYKANVTHDLTSTRPHMKMVETHLSGALLTDLQRHYDSFIRLMRTELSTTTKKVRKLSTLNRYTDRVLAVLNFCKRKGQIDANYRFEPSSFKEMARTRIVAPDEIKALMEAIKEYRPYLEPIVTFNLQVPSRRGELVAMKRDWVDLENLCILIPAEATKSKRACIKPIPPNMVDYFRAIPKESVHAFYRFDRDEYKSLGDFKKAWQYCREKAGVKDLKFHDGRRHSASALIKANVSEREVMQVANWSSNMISVYYNNSGVGAAMSVSRALSSVQESVQDSSVNTGSCGINGDFPTLKPV